MKGTKIQQQNGKVKYIYDYPANREIAKHINSDDKVQIAFRTGYTLKYVREWCLGHRQNNSISEWAHRIMKLNIAKQRKLNQTTEPSTN